MVDTVSSQLASTTASHEYRAGRIERFAQIAVGSVFLLAVIGKLLDFSSLQSGIASLDWLPNRLALPAADLLLCAEATTAYCLLSGNARSSGARLGLILSARFFATTTVKMLQGTSTFCHCFGLFLSLPPQLTLLIDTLLALACGFLVTHNGCRNSAESSARQ